jgi:hypothetical protein
LAYLDISIWHVLTQQFVISWHKHLTCVDTSICYVGFEIVLIQFYKQTVSIIHISLQWIVVWFQTTIWFYKYVYMHTLTVYLVLLLYCIKIITGVMSYSGNNCCNWIAIPANCFNLIVENVVLFGDAYRSQYNGYLRPLSLQTDTCNYSNTLPLFLLSYKKSLKKAKK